MIQMGGESSFFQKKLIKAMTRMILFDVTYININEAH